MTVAGKTLRVLAVASSVTLLAGYVVYSQRTPNVPPPNPFEVNSQKTSSVRVPFRRSSFWQRLFESRHASNDSPTPPQAEAPVPLRGDLRIISSKVINQPVFSVRTFHWSFGTDQSSSDPFALPYPGPVRPPKTNQKRAGTWLSGYEMTGLSIDPLKAPATP